MARLLLALISAVAFLALGATSATATLLTFEDIHTTCCAPVSMPDGYGGLNWTSD